MLSRQVPVISRVATRLLHSTSPVSAQKNSIVGFRQGFDNLFDNFFGKDVASALSPSLHDSDFFSHWPHLTNTSLKWDLVEKPDCFEIKADLPGFKKEEVTIDVENGVLKLSAEHNESKDEDKEEKGVRYHRVERSTGSLYRTVKLPSRADADAVTAKAEDGVLTIRIGKRSAAAPPPAKRVTIE